MHPRPRKMLLLSSKVLLVGSARCCCCVLQGLRALEKKVSELASKQADSAAMEELRVQVRWGMT